MTIVNLSPVLDSLTGTTGTPATFRAVAMRAGRTAVRVAGPSVTFPTQLIATWDGYGWDATPTLHTLPVDCYWNVRVAAAGNRLERNAILPSTDGVVDFADLIDVTPDTGQPDTSAVAQWAALQQYIGNQANRIDGVAATIFATVGTVQAQIDTAATATAQAAAAAAEAAAEQAALAADLAGVTTSTQAATDAALQAAADRAAADADAAQTAADRIAVATDRTAFEAALGSGGTVQAQIDTAVNALVNGAPGALNTLRELADAIGDDANFAATVTNALASKANLAALAAVALSGAYGDLTGRPTLATVATSGSYTDLTNTPAAAATYTDSQAAAAAPVQSVAGKTGTVTITKTDVGLGLVSNIAPADLPVSSAQAAADAAVQAAGLQKTANLSDLASAATARTNLGLGTAATAATTAFDAAGAAATAAAAAQAYAIQRTNHTGTQAASTITGLATVATSGSYTDLTNTPTITSYTDEQAQDATAALFAAGTHTGVSFAYNDAGNALSATVTATGSSLQTRTTVAYTSGTLADAATVQASVTMAAGWRVLKVQTSAAARIRLYAGATYQAADVARSTSTTPTGDHGLLLEYVTTTGVLTAVLSPTVDGYTADASTTVPLTVTNLSGAAAAVTVTLTWIRTE